MVGARLWRLPHRLTGGARGAVLGMTLTVLNAARAAVVFGMKSRTTVYGGAIRSKSPKGTWKYQLSRQDLVTTKSGL